MGKEVDKSLRGSEMKEEEKKKMKKERQESGSHNTQGERRQIKNLFGLINGGGWIFQTSFVLGICGSN